jgi:hypothetical protein
MNLQEIIKRILREELSARVRRRVPHDEMEKEFLESFESAYNLTKRRKVLSTHFLDELIYTTITMMMDGHHWRFVSTIPEDVFWYDDIHTELENHYRDRITQMYNEREGINESILREGELHLTPQKLVKNLPQELKELLFKQWGAKQNPEWHPEGNTLKHILVVIKRAYHHYPDDPNMVIAALFHDLGKIDTYKINPKTGQPTAYGHEDKSTDYVEQFRDWIESFEGTDVDEIKYLVKNHMKVKPSTWDQMKDKKKEPIMSHPAFDKLMGFTDKLDGGGTHLKESIKRILREESVLTRVKRRLRYIDWWIEFSVKEVKRQNDFCKMGEDDFVETVIEKTIEQMYWDFFSDMDDNSSEWSDSYKFMVKYLKSTFENELRQNYHLNCGN